MSAAAMLAAPLQSLLETAAEIAPSEAAEIEMKDCTSHKSDF
jgi:hypothetical protein